MSINVFIFSIAQTIARWTLFQEMLQFDTIVSNDDQEIRMAKRLGQSDSVKTNLKIKVVVIPIT